MIKKVFEYLKRKRIKRIQATIHNLKKKMSHATIDLNWNGEIKKAAKISSELGWKIHKLQLKLKALNK